LRIFIYMQTNDLNKLNHELKEMNIGKRYFILIEYVFENNLARWTARIMTKKGWPNLFSFFWKIVLLIELENNRTTSLRIFLCVLVLSSDKIINCFDSTAHHRKESNITKGTILAFFGLTSWITLENKNKEFYILLICIYFKIGNTSK
jgi:hypothetical protein